MKYQFLKIVVSLESLATAPNPAQVLELSVKPLNDLAAKGWEVIAFVPTETANTYLALLKGTSRSK